MRGWPPRWARRSPRMLVSSFFVGTVALGVLAMAPADAFDGMMKTLKTAWAWMGGFTAASSWWRPPGRAQDRRGADHHPLMQGGRQLALSLILDHFGRSWACRSSRSARSASPACW